MRIYLLTFTAILQSFLKHFSIFFSNFSASFPSAVYNSSSSSFLSASFSKKSINNFAILAIGPIIFFKNLNSSSVSSSYPRRAYILAIMPNAIGTSILSRKSVGSRGSPFKLSSLSSATVKGSGSKLIISFMQSPASMTSPGKVSKQPSISSISAPDNSAPSLSSQPLSFYLSNFSHFFSNFSRHFTNFLINLQAFFKHFFRAFSAFFLSFSDNSPASSSYKSFMSSNFNIRSSMISLSLRSFFNTNLRNLFSHLFVSS